MSELNEKNLWDYADLQSLGYGCRTKIWKMVKREKFPQPIDDGNGNPRWLPAEIKRHFASKSHYIMSQPKQLKKFQESLGNVAAA